MAIRDLRQTRTYVEMEVPKEVYDLIAQKFRDAGYDHVFMRDGTLDMHGIGLKVEDAKG